MSKTKVPTEAELAKDKKSAALIVRQSMISKAIGDKSIADTIFNKITELESQGGLDLPSNFSPGNALKSAWLIFQDNPKLMKCSDSSKANSMLDMIIQGLSPSKNQCYFIPYGEKAQMQRSYLGNVAVTKRLEIVDQIFAQVIHKGDVLQTEISDGILKIVSHKHPWENNDEDVIGAYCIINLTNGNKIATIMTIKEIMAAWQQGAAGGTSPAHKKFPGEMAKKTVMNRACKLFLNTSDDSDLLAESINRTPSLDEVPIEQVVAEEIEESANSEDMDFENGNEIEDAEFEETVVEKETEKKEATKEATKKAGPGF